MKKFFLLLIAAIFWPSAAFAQDASPSVTALAFPNPEIGGGISWKPTHADQHIMPRHGPWQLSTWRGRSFFTGSQFDNLTPVQARERIGYFCRLAVSYGFAYTGASGYPKIEYTTPYWIGVSSQTSGGTQTWTRKIACELRPDLQPPSYSGLRPGPQTWYIFTAYPTH